jgi:hypothetical protein
MTDLLHDALEALQRLPPERQDYRPCFPALRNEGSIFSARGF